MILACDAGGTEANVALAVARDAGLGIGQPETCRRLEHASRDEIAATFVPRLAPVLANDRAPLLGAAHVALVEAGR